MYPLNMGKFGSTVMKSAVLALAALICVLATTTTPAVSQEAKLGSISGSIVDAKTGDAILGVNVFVVGTKLGAVADLDGRFSVKNVPPGTYSIKASSVEYNTMTVDDVVVEPGKVTKLNFTLTTRVLQLDNSITVTAKAVNNTEAVMLKERQGASSVQDAISSELISKSGASDAAEAATKITGATVVGGDKVYVRGLGDRYGNTELNGSQLPSSSARKGGVSLDLIPTNILDNIVVTKSFTPDKSGDFTGGSVNLTTKDFPDKRTLVFSTSTSSNTITTGKNVLTQETISPKAWLADDDGYYDYPSAIANNPAVWAALSGKFASITVLDSHLEDTMLVKVRQAVNSGLLTQFVPSTRKAPWNQAHSLSFGDEWSLFGRPLGVIANYNYSRKFSNRTGTRGAYKNGTVGNSYVMKWLYDYQRTEDNYELGGMLGFHYKLSNNHQVGWRYVYNRIGSTVGSISVGPNIEYVAQAEYVRDISSYYTQQRLASSQFDGKHSLFGNRLRAKWRYQAADTYDNAPDARVWTDGLYRVNADSTHYDITSDIQNSWPQQIYQALDGRIHSFNTDFEIPLSRLTSLKFGSATQREDRDKSVTTFAYSKNLNSLYGMLGQYNGDPNAFMANNLGIISVTRNAADNGTIYRFAGWVTKDAPKAYSYHGSSNVDAYYGMMEFQMPLVSAMRVITGLRYEKTHITVQPGKGTGADRIKYDRLHSLNLVYALSSRMNLRLSYGETVARPTMRELSPGGDLISEEGSRLGGLFEGNPDLRLTNIKNYDLRWEWFRRPGEVFALTLFLKKFTNPIEIVITGPNGSTAPENVPGAQVKGVELEMRSRLDPVWGKLKEVTVGGNFTLVDAWMKLVQFEFEDIHDRWPNASNRRDMFGQSPYIINADISWDHFNSGTSVALFYNVSGERLAYNSAGIDADIYEMPRHQLDFTFSQRILGPKFKLGIKNILDQDIVFKYVDKLPPEGQRRGDQEATRYHRGVTYSIGMSYPIW